MLASRTILSLDQRFTRLRGGESRSQQLRGGGFGGVASGRIDFRSGGGASLKNRRLALEFSKRPEILEDFVRNKLRGSNAPRFSTPIRPRRSGGFNRFRGGLGRGGLRRSGSLSSLGGLSPGVFRGGGLGTVGRSRPFKRSGSLSRSQSLQSLNGLGTPNFRGRLGVRGGRGRGRFQRRGGSGRLSRASSLQSLNAVNGGFRGRGRGGRGGRRSMSVSRGFTDRRNQLRQQTGRGRGGGRGSGVGRGRGRGGGRNLVNSGRGRGRGGMRRGGRGAGGGGNWWSNGPPPSKDDLDKELDQYMSSTKVSLDKELDSYMNQSEEKWD